MIEFKIDRFALKDTYTIGTLSFSIDTQPYTKLCNTLEDTVRDLNKDGKFDNGEKKIWGKTAIPYGIYKFKMMYSPHFKRILPVLQNVPDFEGVMIHNGNTEFDTRGCILVGVNSEVGKVTNSVATLNILLALIEKYKQEEYTITII